MTRLYDIDTGEEFGIFVLIQNADVRVDRNGKSFIAFRFQDRSGSMDGMYWSAKENEVQKFQPGKVVFLRGRRDVYQGTPQVKISQLRLADIGEPQDPTLYVERSSRSRSELEELLNDALFDIKEPNIARVVRKILNQYENEFYTYPAAKRHHHAVAGGLSEHSVTMVQMARHVLSVYPNLNASLLIGGAILHDIGKIYELSGMISTEYTLKGKLMGHIVIGEEMIERACIEIGIDPDIEPILLLKHVVLASHGKLEYGSPVVPQLLEAEIVHHLDDMDAKINMISNVIGEVEPGNFSSSIYALDRRQIYKPKFK